jgi:hypothetical protein
MDMTIDKANIFDLVRRLGATQQKSSNSQFFLLIKLYVAQN